MQAPSPMTVALENELGVSFKQPGSARPSSAKVDDGISITQSRIATSTEERMHCCKSLTTSMMWPFAQEVHPSPAHTRWLISPVSEIIIRSPSIAAETEISLEPKTSFASERGISASLSRALKWVSTR